MLYVRYLQIPGEAIKVFGVGSIFDGSGLWTALMLKFGHKSGYW